MKEENNFFNEISLESKRKAKSFLNLLKVLVLIILLSLIF